MNHGSEVRSGDRVTFLLLPNVEPTLSRLPDHTDVSYRIATEKHWVYISVPIVEERLEGYLFDIQIELLTKLLTVLHFTTTALDVQQLSNIK